MNDENAKFINDGKQLLDDFQKILEQIPEADDSTKPPEPLNPFEAQRVIDEFAQLNFPPEKKKTFLEIIERGHLENVSSKALAFFLDTTERHGLGDLCLQVIMDLANRPLQHSIKTLFVRREVTCEHDDRKGRIDLLIETNQHIIAIENKLSHHANDNPFDIYQYYVDQKYKEHDRTYILMGLDKPSRNDLGEFKFVSHYDFVKEVKNRLGHHLMNADQHYVTHLVDYLNTIENSNPNTEIGKMEQAIVDFYRKNYEILQKIQENREVVFEYYSKKMQTTIDLLENSSINMFDHSNIVRNDLNIEYTGVCSCSKIYTSKLNPEQKFSFWIALLLNKCYLGFEQFNNKFNKVSYDLTIDFLKKYGISHITSDDDMEIYLLELPENTTAEDFAVKAESIIKNILSIHDQEL